MIGGFDRLFHDRQVFKNSVSASLMQTFSFEDQIYRIWIAESHGRLIAASDFHFCKFRAVMF